jgi:hypothetical protein
MFWSFLPWIFVFLWAIGYRIFNWLRNGMEYTVPEFVSFFGFLLTYLAVKKSSSITALYFCSLSISGYSSGITLGFGLFGTTYS